MHVLNNKNYVRGIFLIAISLAFGLPSLGYPIGEFGRAGPGLFPLMVSVMLLLVGIASVVRARFAQPDPMDIQFRNISLVMAALCGFAVISHFVNMIAGIVFLVFCSSYAGVSPSLWRSAKITAGLVLVALAFKFGLGVQLPLY